jgi:hypothetical protein
VKGVCGHLFHFHCLATFLKRRQVCPVDESEWEFSRIGDRYYVEAPNPTEAVCHRSHPELYRTITRYRVIRCAGRFDIASYTMLVDIHTYLAMMGHPYAPVFGNCIRRLPEGGMMINIEDWEWLFRFLDKLAVSSLSEKGMTSAGFEDPPSWMGRPRSIEGDGF